METLFNTLPVGTLLHNGKYRVQSLISSKGGFGLTYKVVDTSTYHTYAIKEFFMSGINARSTTSINGVYVPIDENKALFEKFKAKFKHEAQVLQTVHHPNVIKVFEWFEENETCYYVMDFIDGENLLDRLERTRKAFDESTVKQILLSLLEALEAIHNKRIWHLDIKPNNIMIDQHGHITLIDFGSSRQLTAKDLGKTHFTRLTNSGNYTPDEQLNGKDLKYLGPWSDFYALGGTLYRLLTNNDIPSSIDITLKGESAFSYPSATSNEMKSLIIWMMQRDAPMRPQSVDEIRRRMRETGMISSIGTSTHQTGMMKPEEISARIDNEATIFNYQPKPNQITNEETIYKNKGNVDLIFDPTTETFYYSNNRQSGSKKEGGSNSKSIAWLLVPQTFPFMVAALYPILIVLCKIWISYTVYEPMCILYPFIPSLAFLVLVKEDRSMWFKLLGIILTIPIGVGGIELIFNGWDAAKGTFFAMLIIISLIIPLIFPLGIMNSTCEAKTFSSWKGSSLSVLSVFSTVLFLFLNNYTMGIVWGFVLAGLGFVVLLIYAMKKEDYIKGFWTLPLVMSFCLTAHSYVIAFMSIDFDAILNFIF